LRTYTRRRSINFTNVRKERGHQEQGAVLRCGEPELSYAYGDQEYFDVNTAYENTRTYRGSLGLAAQPQARPSSPSNVGFVSKSKWLKLIKDFNVNMGFKQLPAHPWTACTWSAWCAPTPTSNRCRHAPPTTRTSTGAASTASATSSPSSLKLDFNANNLAIIGEHRAV
jgi:cell surface protein SprA